MYLVPASPVRRPPTWRRWPVLFPEMKRRGRGRRLVALLAAPALDDRDDPAQPRADHHRLGDRRLDRRAVHRRPAAGLRRRLALWSSSPAAARATRTRARGARRRARSCAAFVVALPALALPFVIRAAVIGASRRRPRFRPSASSIPMLVGLFVYRQFDWRRLHPMLVETAALSGAILLIIGMATAMAWALTQSGFSRRWRGDRDDARRQGRVPRGLDRRLHRTGQRARGHPRDRAVRAVAVPIATRRSG